MSVSAASTITRSSVLSGLSNSGSAYCSTCGRATAATSSIYAGYGGRVGTDTYVCETCGKSYTSQGSSAGQSKNTYGVGQTTSGYCPRCNASSKSTTSWTGGSVATASSTSSAKPTYGSVSWTR